MKRKGLLLRADDLEVGRLVTIHHWKDGRQLWLGQACEVRAVNLPYAVIRPMRGPGARSRVIDLRLAVLMPITEEFARAQAECAALPDDYPPEPPALEDNNIPF